MPLIALNITVTDKSPLRGLGRRWGQIQRASLQAVARHWQATILPKHFTPGNRSRYGLAPRNRLYMQKIKQRKGKGQGKWVDDLLTGQSRRWMQSLSTITGSRNHCTLRMKAPAWFTNPFIGSYRDPKSGKTKTVSQQPDKPAEATAISADDRANLIKFLQGDITMRVALARQTP